MSESNEKFWTVHGGSGCRYPKPEGAGDEVEYLAKKNPGHVFWVMESIISAKTSGALTWTEAKVKAEPAAPRWPQWECETCKTIIPHFAYPCPNCYPSQPPTPGTP